MSQAACLLTGVGLSPKDFKEIRCLMMIACHRTRTCLQIIPSPLDLIQLVLLTSSLRHVSFMLCGYPFLCKCFVIGEICTSSWVGRVSIDGSGRRANKNWSSWPHSSGFYIMEWIYFINMKQSNFLYTFRIRHIPRTPEPCHTKLPDPALRTLGQPSSGHATIALSALSTSLWC